MTDEFLGNGNDSGGVDYSGTAPVLGVLYKLTPTLNVYASAARGFETPTLNELFYSGNGNATSRATVSAKCSSLIPGRGEPSSSSLL